MTPRYVASSSKRGRTKETDEITGDSKGGDYLRKIDNAGDHRFFLQGGTYRGSQIKIEKYKEAGKTTYPVFDSAAIGRQETTTPRRDVRTRSMAAGRERTATGPKRMKKIEERKWC